MLSRRARELSARLDELLRRHPDLMTVSLAFHREYAARQISVIERLTDSHPVRDQLLH
jgi:hypothetical protein